MSAAGPRLLVPETVQTLGYGLRARGAALAARRLRQGRARAAVPRAGAARRPRRAVLDEPLGALDPQTARTVLAVARRRARTLVVISQE